MYDVFLTACVLVLSPLPFRWRVQRDDAALTSDIAAINFLCANKFYVDYYVVTIDFSFDINVARDRRTNLICRHTSSDKL